VTANNSGHNLTLNNYEKWKMLIIVWKKIVKKKIKNTTVRVDNSNLTNGEKGIKMDCLLLNTQQQLFHALSWREHCQKINYTEMRREWVFIYWLVFNINFGSIWKEGIKTTEAETLDWHWKSMEGWEGTKTFSIFFVPTLFWKSTKEILNVQALCIHVIRLWSTVSIQVKSYF
jgi:hypothetical protein